MKTLSRRFQALNKFEFSFNYIGCNRSEELQAYFKSKNIATDSSSKAYNGSKKTQFRQNDKGCIDDGEWLSLKLIENGEKQDEALGNNGKDRNNLLPIIFSATFVIIFVINHQFINV